MKVWAVGVVIFFGLAELYQWFHSFSLPLPVYGIAGLLLALVSNAQRWSHLIPPIAAEPASSQSPRVQTTVQSSVAQTHNSPCPQPISRSSQPTNEPVELPVLGQQAAQPWSEPIQPPISFTIRKPQR